MIFSSWDQNDCDLKLGKFTYVYLVEIVNFLSLKIKMTLIVILIGALDKSHDQIHEKNQTTWTIQFYLDQGSTY